jgi:Zn-dependent peptidase ImmA (M78 family)
VWLARYDDIQGPDEEATHMPSATQRRAENLAEEILDKHWVQGDAWIELPIDPVQIAADMGIEVERATFKDPDTSGAIRVRSGQATIYISSTDAPTRQRFTCAHELGHYVDRLDSGEDVSDFGYIDFRDARASTGTNVAEIFANGFAAALLMPAYLVLPMRKEQNLTVSELADRFGVSFHAADLRVTNLHHLF